MLAGGFSYLVFQRLENAAAERPKTTKIVAAAKDLRQGIPLTAEDIVMIEWPEDLVLAGSVTKAEQVVGRPLMIPISERRPILDRDLAAPGSGIGLTVKIPQGMRATAVRSNEIVGVAGFLYPGSHVDVLATYTPPGGSIPVTQTVLQNVEVLTTGTATEPDPQGKPQTVNVVTLLLNPEDSQSLQLISNQATIQFVLRSGVDTEKVTVPPTRLDQLMMGYRPPAPPAPVRPAPKPAPRNPDPPKVVEPPKPVEVVKPAVVAPKPQIHRLEIIQGTQRKDQEFIID